jgi:hypothetical protein
VKKSAKRLSGQMNLSLLNPPATIIPDGKQGELTLALVELLTSAAQEDAKQESPGGKDEFEAHAGTSSQEGDRLRSPVQAQPVDP